MCSCVSAEPSSRGCSLLDVTVRRDAQRLLLDAFQPALQDARFACVDEGCEPPLEGAIYAGAAHAQNRIRPTSMSRNITKSPARLYQGWENVAGRLCSKKK